MPGLERELAAKANQIMVLEQVCMCTNIKSLVLPPLSTAAAADFVFDDLVDCAGTKVCNTTFENVTT